MIRFLLFSRNWDELRYNLFIMSRRLVLIHILNCNLYQIEPTLDRARSMGAIYLSKLPDVLKSQPKSSQLYIAIGALSLSLDKVNERATT